MFDVECLAESKRSEDWWMFDVSVLKFQLPDAVSHHASLEEENVVQLGLLK
jgi:hypothetical protein